MGKSLEIRLEDRLRQMKDKTYLYNSYPVKVLSFKFDGKYCTVTTSGPWITRPNVQMLKVFNEFLETEAEGDYLPATIDKESSDEEKFQIPKVETLDNFPKLSRILIDNIKKVQEDRAYVEQAQQVSLSVKMVIELAKNEIEAVRTVNDIVRNR